MTNLTGARRNDFRILYSSLGTREIAPGRRLTENPTPTDVARGYLEEAERYVALAASVIGEEEAARVAKETRGGPLIRECRL
jgi:hypothetical protein